MAYFLFLLVNANLFLRPAELVPDLEKLPLYFWFIFACLIASIPKLLGLIRPDTPLRHPVTLCVLGIAGFVVLSHFAQSSLDDLAIESFEFLKVVIYFVLFLTLIDSPAKLRWLLGTIILCGVTTSLLSILQFHHAIDLPNLKSIEEVFIDDKTGELMRVRRLMLTGILHDPNEFCLFLGVLCILTLHQLGNHKLGFFRFLWLPPLCLFLYGIYLTKSRGGLLALLAGLATYAICAWGARRAAFAGVFLLPVLLIGVLAGGRQTDISITEGTGRARLELWSDWMMKFRGSPVFGESPKITVDPIILDKELRYNYQQVAHNSYLQSFADLGLVGGMLFLGAFVFAVRTMTRFYGDEVNMLDSEQRRLYPFIFGALIAYMTGMMSLSLSYVLPTYVILVLPVAFAHMTATQPSIEEVRIDGRAVRQVAFASVGMLAVIFFCVKVFRV